MSKSSNVKVYCRIRPENEQEISSGLGICLNPQSQTSVHIIVDNLNINSGLKENYSEKQPKNLLMIRFTPLKLLKKQYLNKSQSL